MASKKKPAAKKTAAKKTARKVVPEIVFTGNEKLILKRLSSLESNIQKALAAHADKMAAWQQRQFALSMKVSSLGDSLESVVAAKAKFETFRLVPPEDVDQIEDRFDVQTQMYELLEGRIKRIENDTVSEEKIIACAVRIQDKVRSRRPQTAEIALHSVKRLQERVVTLEHQVKEINALKSSSS